MASIILPCFPLESEQARSPPEVPLGFWIQICPTPNLRSRSLPVSAQDREGLE